MSEPTADQALSALAHRMAVASREIHEPELAALRAEVKELREKLAAERTARADAEERLRIAHKKLAAFGRLP